MYRECTTHGMTKHYVHKEGGFRCAECAKDAVNKRRRKVKAILVQENGGCCSKCGYDRCLDALVFHHPEDVTKDFGLGNGLGKSLAKLRVEANKCLLLCANCHTEHHACVV